MTHLFHRCKDLDPTKPTLKAMMVLNNTVQQQAQMLSYLDIFKIMANRLSWRWWVLVLFLRRKSTAVHKGDAAPAH